jgi:hypothetical protein
MLLITLVILAATFALVVFFGAPYLPTHKRQIEQALDLTGLKPGQTVLDLGAGDGRLLKAAAERGLNAVGYELNPWLVLVCRLRLGGRAKIIWNDFLRAEWPAGINAVYIFGSRPVMRRLSRKLNSVPKPLRLVSYGFELPGHKPKRQSNGFYVYDLNK